MPGENSHETTRPPLIRVVQGNFSLWSASERYQCTWQDEGRNNTPNRTDQNSNNPAFSNINAADRDPPDAAALTTGSGNRDRVARVEVCVQAFYNPANNRENCTEYGSNLKPEGLLQRFGLDDQVRFALMTGSYENNVFRRHAEEGPSIPQRRTTRLACATK